MSASIVTFADLGKKKNLKTIDIAPLISILEEQDELGQVICRMKRQAPVYVSATISPFIHYALKLVERLLPSFPARNIEEWLLDTNAARKLRKTDITFFHPNLFPKTIRQAKKLGSITIGIAVLVHPTTSQEIIHEEYQRLHLPDRSINRKGFYGIFNTASVANSFDYIIAISDHVKETYVEHGFPAERIFVAPIDFDSDAYKTIRPMISEGVFRVVYMAHTTPIKGLHYLLDAWQSLHLPNAELFIVGGYAAFMPKALKEQYNSIIANNPSIRWVGYTPNPLRYYQQASLVVFPTLAEGFGRVILESMASGVPVITTENARGIVEDGITGYIVPIRDSKAIAEKIRYLYENPERISAMGDAARNAVLQKQSFGKTVYDIYKTLLNRHESK